MQPLRTIGWMDIVARLWKTSGHCRNAVGLTVLLMPDLGAAPLLLAWAVAWAKARGVPQHSAPLPPHHERGASAPLVTWALANSWACVCRASSGARRGHPAPWRLATGRFAVDHLLRHPIDNAGGSRDDYRLDPICAIEGSLCCRFAVPNEYQIDTVDTDEFSQVSDF